MNMNNELSTTELAELLQATSQQLDTIVAQLRAGEVENLPPQLVEKLVAETAALAAACQPPPALIEPIEETTPPATIKAEIAPVSAPDDFFEEIEATEAIEATETEIPATEVIWLDRFLPSFSDLQTWWDTILSKIRNLLPQSWQEKASDWVITGIITGVIVAALLSAVLLLPKAPAEVAEVPPPAIETPPELKAPGRPEPVEITPPPEPLLTPEQSLIAGIQDEVSSLTREYPPGLLHSVEADFLGSRLTVTVGEKWLELGIGKQDKFANAVLQRSRKLDFRKLEIVNLQGNLLARNPVVGDNMIILQREK